MLVLVAIVLLVAVALFLRIRRMIEVVAVALRLINRRLIVVEQELGLEETAACPACKDADGPAHAPGKCPRATT